MLPGGVGRMVAATRCVSLLGIWALSTRKMGLPRKYSVKRRSFSGRKMSSSMSVKYGPAVARNAALSSFEP